MERRLAAILAADMVAYSRLMAADETGTIERHKAHRRALIDPKISQYCGRIVKTTGDGMLVEFSSVVDAVLCGVEIQHGVLAHEAQVPDAERIRYRVGINLGDIVIDGEDILGDGVNIAARLEGLAEPGGICVSRPVHTQIKGKLDLTFEHLGEKEVKNIAEPVSVYRVVFDEKTTGLITPLVRKEAMQTRWRLPIAAAAVVFLLAVGGVIWWQPWAPEFVPASVENMAHPLPDKPSIAVLPFANIGNDEEQQYLADGITSDLITDLSRFGDLFVVAANSSFTYKGKPVHVQQVAEELGVQYLLEGSVQRVGDTIRINAQLIDALSGHHLWAERYDREAGDFFAIQDEILKTIIGTLQPQVKNIEKERAFKRPTENLTAYDYFKRGVAYFQEWEKESNSKAREMQEKAIELDPEYARAYSSLGLIHANDWLHDWSEDRAQSHALALQYARKGVELDPDDYWNIWALARIYDWFGQTDLARSNYDRALSLNPYDPGLLMNVAELQVSLGEAEQAVEQAKTAMRYNPRYPDGYLWMLGWVQYFAGQHEEAVATLQKMTNPPNGVRRTLAAALVQVGRVDEAREMIEEFVKNAPEYTLADIKRQPIHHPYIDKWVKDLRTAGLPE